MSCRQVQPDLEVKVKPSMHQRKLAEAKAQRMLVRDELWARRRIHEVTILASLLIYLLFFTNSSVI